MLWEETANTSQLLSHAFRSNVGKQLAWQLVQIMNCFCLVCCHLPMETGRGCRGHKCFLHSQNYPFRPPVCSTEKTWDISFHQLSSRDAQRQDRRDYLSPTYMALPWVARICHQHQHSSCVHISNLVQGCTSEANLLFIPLAVWLELGRVLGGYKLGSSGWNQTRRCASGPYLAHPNC